VIATIETVWTDGGNVTDTIGVHLTANDGPDWKLPNGERVKNNKKPNKLKGYQHDRE